MLSSSILKQLAADVGFSDCGIAVADRLADDEYPLDAWLAAGFHADMAYMERNAEMRRDPRLLMDGARSVISLLVGYKPDRQIDTQAALPAVEDGTQAETSTGSSCSLPAATKIAYYAYGEDYHERLKRMMYQLIAKIKEHYPDFEGRPFVDTAPISDRHWAVRAGLGWIGKNNLFFHPRLGSWCFIGDIVTTAEFDHYDTSSIQSCNHPCTNCTRCIDACPNHAIVEIENRNGNGNENARIIGHRTHVTMIDARRCTSYNTIENRAESLPAELNTRGYIFGCDICQLVCPMNKDIPATMHLDDSRKAELESLPTADESTFRRLTKHSAINRVKYPQWQRNMKR